MVQISTVVGGRLSSVESSVAGAGRVAEAVSAVSSGGGKFSGGDGADIERDQQHLAASGKFVAEGKARSAANANAAEAATLLQIADDALVLIREKLDRLDELALAAEDKSLSIADRAKMDIDFQTVKDEIDLVAADTAFRSTKLLQGGAGPGGAFEVSFKVGTGNETHDEITVSIAPASVADLSSGLEAGGVTSMVGASTARTNIAAARDALDTIRSGIAGDRERFSVASSNNSVISRELDISREALTTPAVVIDIAQLVARRAADDGGFHLSSRTMDQLRNLLLRLDTRDYSADTGTASGAGGPAGAGAGANVGTASSDGSPPGSVGTVSSAA